MIMNKLIRKVAKQSSEGMRPATLLKKRPWHRCFPANFEKFLRTPFLTEHLQWLPLNLRSSNLNLFPKVFICQI